jgi:hypothetical protein
MRGRWWRWSVEERQKLPIKGPFLRLLSPLLVHRERARVRAVFEIWVWFVLQQDPHPNPLPEYQERG